jgi:hypothetical protein
MPIYIPFQNSPYEGLSKYTKIANFSTGTYHLATLCSKPYSKLLDRAENTYQRQALAHFLKASMTKQKSFIRSAPDKEDKEK